MECYQQGLLIQRLYLLYLLIIFYLYLMNLQGFLRLLILFLVMDTFKRFGFICLCGFCCLVLDDLIFIHEECGVCWNVFSSY